MNSVVRMLAMTDCGYSPVHGIAVVVVFAILKQRQIVVMKVVCFERVCYEWVCYERGLF